MRIPGRNAWTLICICLLVSLACDKPTPVAPVDSVLTATANPTRIPVDGASEITVIARKADGTAVNPGTEINISTDLGTIDPKLALTNDRGIATATLRGDGRVGTATITVSSGAGMEDEVTVQIGSRPTTITLQANPPRIPRSGGTSTLVASVADDLGNAIEDVVVRFNTEAGTLASGGGSVRTDRSGDAIDTLTLTAFDVDGVPTGLFDVTAETVDTEGTPIEEVFTMEIGGFLASISLTSNPGTVSATTGGEFLLTAVAQDDGGGLLEGEGIIFATDVGSLASQGRLQLTDADGVATDTLTVTPVDLGVTPPQAVNVNATGKGLGNEDVIGTEQIFVSGVTGSLSLVAVPSSIPFTGTVPPGVQLTATVIDEAGVPVEGASVVFTKTVVCLLDTSMPGDPPFPCSSGTLASGGGLVITDSSGRAPDVLTATAADLSDGATTQWASSITVTAEVLLPSGQLASDSVVITVTGT